MDLEFYKNIFSKSQDLIGILDKNDHFCFINPRLKTLLGYNEKEFFSKPFYEWLHPEDKETSKEANINTRNLGTEYLNFQNRYMTKSGKTKWISWSVWTNNLKQVISVGRDITLIKKIIEDKQSAEVASLEKTKFLSKVSHELRTPLNAIIGFSQLMKIDAKLNDQYLTNILNSSELLLKLINDILDISTMEQFENLSMNKTWCDFSKILEKAINTLPSLATIEPGEDYIVLENNITIINNMKTTFFFYLDNSRVLQIILNLLTNAIKYNKKNGKVFISSKITNSNLYISVQDTGIGISEENLKRLYIPFNRLGMEYSNIKGTGLGLALVKKLLTIMKCELIVESKLEVGSTFTIMIPDGIYTTNIIIEEEKEDYYEDTYNLVEKKTIIYVEDNYLNFYLVKQILLKYENITLINATDGKSGLEKISELNPDLLLLDTHLPDISGLDILKYISEHIYDICPIVILSADAYEMSIKKMINAGADDYLVKPLNIPKFLKTIFKYLIP